MSANINKQTVTTACQHIFAASRCPASPRGRIHPSEVIGSETLRRAEIPSES